MLTRKNAVLKHHDQSPSVQQRFVAHTKALVIAFKRQVTLLTRIATKSSLSTPERLSHIMMPAVSWVHMEKERSSMPLLWRIASTAVAFHASIKMNKIHLPANRHKNRNRSKDVDSTKKEMHLRERETSLFATRWVGFKHLQYIQYKYNKIPTIW